MGVRNAHLVEKILKQLAQNAWRKLRLKEN